ncbi:MAG: DUF1080 domain-containing protein [Balneolaceae bacterium]|nr:DUF1080 domain-containing protein [Balneolaceae bacterium]
MKALLLTFLFSFSMFGFMLNSDTDTETETLPKTLTQEEIDEGWELLFDGVSTENWRVYNQDSFPEHGWTVEDGVLIFRPVEGVDTGPLDLITNERYQDFELELEWWISERGNSGIFHHIVEQPDQAIFWSGIEMQILDNDAFPNLDDNQLSGALYEKKAPEPQNTRPQGEWNSVRIVSDGPSVEYWQNGELVVEFERWSPEWYDLIRGTKFECHPSFGNAPKGHIGLQDHGDEVRFRNIRIREL